MLSPALMVTNSPRRNHLLELQPLHARAPVEEAPRPLLLLGLEVDRALVAQQQHHDDSVHDEAQNPPAQHVEDQHPRLRR